jgi:hypothetical protein
LNRLVACPQACDLTLTIAPVVVLGFCPAGSNHEQKYGRPIDAHTEFDDARDCSSGGGHRLSAGAVVLDACEDDVV